METLMTNAGSNIIVKYFFHMACFIAVFFVFIFPVTTFAYDIGIIGASSLKQNYSRWMVLDARPMNLWKAGHLPNARSLSWETYTRTDEKKIPYRVWPPEQMAAVLGKMGINEKTPVVVYGDADKSWGGEGWVCWLLLWLGHQGDIRLLDGGMEDWMHTNGSLDAGDSVIISKQEAYNYKVNNSIEMTTEGLLKGSSDYYLVDTRSMTEWFMGHIPGAIHIKWTEFYKGHDRKPLSPGETNALLSTYGIKNDKPVVYYCAGGIRSAYAWMVHSLSGRQDAMNYEGGYVAWIKRPSP